MNTVTQKETKNLKMLDFVNSNGQHLVVYIDQDLLIHDINTLEVLEVSFRDIKKMGYVLNG